MRETWANSMAVVPPGMAKRLFCGLPARPCMQYGAYAPYAYQEGLISKGLRDRILMVSHAPHELESRCICLPQERLTDTPPSLIAPQLYPACRLALEVCDGINWSVECKLAVAFCQATQFGPVMAAIPGTNVYGAVPWPWLERKGGEEEIYLWQKKFLTAPPMFPSLQTIARNAWAPSAMTSVGWRNT